MKKKLLFLDLDGTLLDNEKQITAGNRKALELALSRGHGVIITTGRPLKSAMEQAHKLGLDGPGCFLIAYNGAAVYDWAQQKQIFSRALSLETVYKVFDLVNAEGEHIQTYDTWDVLVEPRGDDTALRRYCHLSGMGYRVIGDVRKDLAEPPVKCLVINYRDRIREELDEEADCFFSCDQYLEVVPKGMNKGQAVIRMCQMMGVEIADAVAVGDEANDLSMIMAAGVGVAMANGTAQVKAAADYITVCDNNHDGVAEVVEQFLQ